MRYDTEDNQYLAEALGILIDAINEGYSDDDAFTIARNYLCEGYGFGPWSARRALTEVLNEQADENEPA